jgi:YaeC family lipoprotein
LVQLIQSVGDKLAAARKAKPIGYLCILLWIASIVFIVVQALPQKIPELKVGVMSGVNADIMKVAKKVALTDYGLNLKIVTFDDYVLPNTALNSGDIDANIFQHTPYLDAQIKARHYKLSPIAATFVYPLGFYSKHIKTIGQLKYHAVIAIPNDPSNEGRALRLLALKHVIGLKKSAGLFGTPADITSNPKDLQFKLLAVAQLPRVFKSAALVALTDDFVKVAGFTPNQAVLREGPHAPYANVIVVQTSRRHDAVFEKLIAAMHSKAVLDKTLQLFPDGEAIPAWKAH